MRARWVDRVGSWLGLACAFHCLALPLAVAVLPFVGLEVMGHTEADVGIIGIAAVMATLSVLWGVRRHGALRVAAAFAAAIGVCLVGLELGAHSIAGRVVMAGGALGLVLSHRMNRRLCESCPEDDHSHD